ADVFAAGVVLYEALTGRRPFAGEDDGDVVVGLLIGEAPAPSSVVPPLSGEGDAVLGEAPARGRGERLATPAALPEALERPPPLPPPRARPPRSWPRAARRTSIGAAPSSARRSPRPRRRTATRGPCASSPRAWSSSGSLRWG